MWSRNNETCSRGGILVLVHSRRYLYNRFLHNLRGLIRRRFSNLNWFCPRVREVQRNVFKLVITILNNAGDTQAIFLLKIIIVFLAWARLCDCPRVLRYVIRQYQILCVMLELHATDNETNTPATTGDSLFLVVKRNIRPTLPSCVYMQTRIMIENLVHIQNRIVCS